MDEQMKHTYYLIDFMSIHKIKNNSLFSYDKCFVFSFSVIMDCFCFTDKQILEFSDNIYYPQYIFDDSTHIDNNQFRSFIKDKSIFITKKKDNCGIDIGFNTINLTEYDLMYMKLMDWLE